MSGKSYSKINRADQSALYGLGMFFLTLIALAGLGTAIGAYFSPQLNSLTSQINILQTEINSLQSQLNLLNQTNNNSSDNWSIVNNTLIDLQNEIILINSS